MTLAGFETYGRIELAPMISAFGVLILCNEGSDRVYVRESRQRDITLTLGG